MPRRTETGPWGAAVEQLRNWDPAWAESCLKMTTNPWVRGVLPRKLVELIGVMLNASCTNRDPEGTRLHIRAALEAGATRDEILRTAGIERARGLITTVDSDANNVYVTLSARAMNPRLISPATGSSAAMRLASASALSRPPPATPGACT